MTHDTRQCFGVVLYLCFTEIELKRSLTLSAEYVAVLLYGSKIKFPSRSRHLVISITPQHDTKKEILKPQKHVKNVSKQIEWRTTFYYLPLSHVADVLPDMTYMTCFFFQNKPLLCLFLINGYRR